MDLASKLFKGDRVIWVIFMFLCLVSVIEVFSATSTIAYKNANHWAPIVRHATFLLGGFVLVLLMHNIPCRFYSLLSLLLPVSMVLLAITPFVGVVVNGEPRWLEILGIRFQPSEIAKIAAIGYTAFILSKRNWFTDKQMFWYILGGVGGVCFLIFFNNGSTAILLFAVTFMMMFIGHRFCAHYKQEAREHGELKRKYQEQGEAVRGFLSALDRLEKAGKEKERGK